MRITRGVVLGVVAALAATGTVAARTPAHPQVRIEAIYVQAPDPATLARRTAQLQTTVDVGAVPGALSGDAARAARTVPTAPAPRTVPGPKGQPPAVAAPTTAPPSAGVVRPFSVPAAPSGCGANSRWYFCTVGTFTLRKIVITDGVAKVRGTATATAQTQIWGGPNNARQLDAGTWFTGFTTTGDWNAAPLRITGDLLCDAPCQPTDSYAAPEDVALWRNGPREEGHYFHVPAGGGSAQVAWGTLHPYMAVADDSPTGGVASVIGPGVGIRCDTFGGSSGCVFPSVVPRIDYLTADPTRPEGNSPAVALHIWDAWINPSKTAPFYPDKRVPGRFEAHSPLHRIANTDPQYNANHARAVSICQYFWGTGYTQNGTKQCDEFPFRSAREGAAKPPLPNHNYSARPLSATDNVRAGQALGTFYREERVIPGDAFYVGVYSHYL